MLYNRASGQLAGVLSQKQKAGLFGAFLKRATHNRKFLYFGRFAQKNKF